MLGLLFRNRKEVEKAVEHKVQNPNEIVPDKFIDPFMLKESVDPAMLKSRMAELTSVEMQQTENKKKLEVAGEEVKAVIEKKEKDNLDAPTPAHEQESAFKTHNSVYFYSLKYTNQRLKINKTDSGYMIMPVPDNKLCFGDILDEVNVAKQEFANDIIQDHPGLEIPSEDIILINLNLIIGDRLK